MGNIIMNRINTLFQNKNSQILNIYFTAGFPKIEDTFTVLEALQSAGVDIVEIGIPYSDPLADGETIQNSGQKALDNGMTLSLLLDQLKDIRQKGITVPILLMGYFNTMLQFGIENFLKRCQAIGIDGVIIPDLPIAVFETEYKSLFENYDVLNTFLITPQTSVKRIQQVDKLSTGFIYMVSSASTTGAKADISTNQEAYFERINKMKLSKPKLIGFGISNNETFQKACDFAQGAIIGSAFVNLIEKSSNLKTDIAKFVSAIKG
jgi:tryptophan synthase alpha chain